ncbi:sugar ABC transporter permease [Carboxydochorda subterranea]|uniref:Sugar ABC transporter permease n=1 Tax=Carboxydichorda subterranea TaxID=3109565 RepID=A0ABZ1BUS1_9FIRM|nr:sugar ABC transporter permease [Limnochorda sp. L945t]WRP16556.1 sugar ABC transporter permease [Limnochorda sp. L945t]
MERRRRGELWWGLGFISPWLVGFLAFTLVPVVSSLYYSFTDYNLMNPPRWVGAANFSTLFADPTFYESMKNTVYMVLVGLPVHLLWALVLAFLLARPLKGIAFFRALYYLPTVVPIVASTLLWRWIFNPNYGILNTALNFLGLPEPGWLVDPAWSKPALIIMGMWGVGGTVVIYLAALKEVPRELYEAAELDGATSWRKTTAITLPMISPVLFFTVVVNIIGYFQYFTQAYVFSATGYGGQLAVGGPRNSTMFYALYLYLNAFRFFKMGLASAMAWILFLILLVATLVLLRTSSRWVHYGGARPI